MWGQEIVKFEVVLRVKPFMERSVHLPTIAKHSLGWFKWRQLHYLLAYPSQATCRKRSVGPHYFFTQGSLL